MMSRKRSPGAGLFTFVYVSFPRNRGTRASGNSAGGSGCAGGRSRLGPIRLCPVSLGGLSLNIQLALNDHALGIHIGSHLPVRTNDQPVPGQFDAAFHLAVHVKILATGEFSLDDDGFPNVGKLCGLRRLHRFRPPRPCLPRDRCAGIPSHLLLLARSKTIKSKQSGRPEKSDPKQLMERKPSKLSRTPFCFIELYLTATTGATGQTLNPA